MGSVWFDVMFINCCRFSARWQRSVQLYTEDNSHIHGENNTQNITETQNTQNSKQNTQQEKANIKRVIKKHKN